MSVRALRPLRPSAVLLILLAVGCGGDGSGPPAAAVGLDPAGRLRPSDGDRCPVCAMTVADRPMVCGAELDDGRTYYFCGTGCLLKSLMHPEVYLAAEPDGVARAVVTEYFGGAQLPAERAFWVAGSDVTGAMGPMIVPLARADEVEPFRERHGGHTVFRLEDLDDALWERLTGKPAVRGDGR